jgi:hypothetical protein
MPMDIQEIITPAGETLVVLAKADFLALVGAAEDHADIAAVEAYRKALASGDEDALPLASVRRMLNGESPVRVWREFRGLSISALAKAASLSQPFVSQIERGDRKGTTESLGALARALRVSLDDLV